MAVNRTFRHRRFFSSKENKNIWKIISNESPILTIDTADRISSLKLHNTFSLFSFFLSVLFLGWINNQQSINIHHLNSRSLSRQLTLGIVAIQRQKAAETTTRWKKLELNYLVFVFFFFLLKKTNTFFLVRFFYVCSLDPIWVRQEYFREEFFRRLPKRIRVQRWLNTFANSSLDEITIRGNCDRYIRSEGG